MEQFTASEVRDYLFSIEERSSLQWLIAHDTELGMLRQFADLLEAREKAVPVMVVNHVSSAEHDLPIGMRLYAHPSPAGAERLAEALRNARGFVLHFGDEPARVCIAEIDAALAAHSAQAQPKNVSFVRETWTEDADGDRPNLCTICGKPLRYGTRHTACAIAQSQPPAARVTDAMVERGLEACIQDSDARLSRYKVVRSIIEAALAAQENPNG